MNALLTRFAAFSAAMVGHIEIYTVGQYADYPHDNATGYSVADCLWQMRKYVSRHGTNARAGQDRLDLLKTGHYAAIAAAKIADLPILEGGEKQSYRASEWLAFAGICRDVLEGGLIDIPVYSHPAGAVDALVHILDQLQGTDAESNLSQMVLMAAHAAQAWHLLPEEAAAPAPGRVIELPRAAAGRIRVRRLHAAARLPEVKTGGSAGADLAAVESVKVRPGDVVVVSTGIAVEIPDGFEGQIRARSSVSTLQQLICTNGVGTIDSDYRGEIRVPLKNVGDRTQFVTAGDRIAQLVVKAAPRWVFAWADELTETERGAGGFGSTGMH